ncbi:hypothetical protein EUGRSUZ_E01248 [Eucalyptus grandis]|uniref:Uncharacterized protein n=2 Tax=Eucalyptus grandis TaxID=71139 RepID=A0ACC3KTR5_EUCGR|nr:hypothetical protein EUGRSUZ_E01248 [Eucalyptus grandis]
MPPIIFIRSPMLSKKGCSGSALLLVMRPIEPSTSGTEGGPPPPPPGLTSLASTFHMRSNSTRERGKGSSVTLKFRNRSLIDSAPGTRTAYSLRGSSPAAAILRSSR